MAENPQRNNDDDSEDELRDMLRQFLNGESGFDASQLAGAAGLPSDPASIAALVNQLQGAINTSGAGINWEIALTHGTERATSTQREITGAERGELEAAFNVAALWLDEVISVSELTETPTLISRAAWVRKTMPVWTQLAEPVATSIADALTRALSEQAPEEMRGMVAGAGALMRSIGGTMFAMQLGQVVGQLSSEVVSGGDVGIPLLGDGQAALLPQNVAEFGADLDVSIDQVQIYLAVRELAHARLFRHARWLRLHLITSITEFSRGLHIDTDSLEQLAESFDPSNPSELRDALTNGTLIPPKSDAQLAALARLETMLALIEGWVDVVTAAATNRLPASAAIAEMVRRRRAAGGPAESAFATLVGLELRPRRLREAAAMWQAVTDAVGGEARDALWAHPDIVPGSADLDDPMALVSRLTNNGDDAPLDDFDQALEDLLRDDGPERPIEE